MYLFLAFFSIPHLIDDFLFDVPADFGLNVRFTQFLAGLFILIFMGIFMEVVRGSRLGLYGGMFMGSFLALAGILKHIPLIVKPGPYWSGWFSEGLIIGMILSGISLAAAGVVELKRKNP